MSFINSYKPTEQPALSDEILYGPKPYDINISFPYLPDSLSTDRVRLTPFVPSEHAEPFLDGIKGHESIFSYMSMPLDLPHIFLGFAEIYMRQRADNILFTIIDTTRHDPLRPELNGSVAGVIGLVYTSMSALTTEIGPAIVLPAFQRTHVTSHAVGILMRYALSVPDEGLGMRRVVWSAHTGNAGSNKVAMRMGFRHEGVRRWSKPMFIGKKEGNAPREGDPLPEQLGKDDMVYAVCWDDWETGVKDIVDRAIARI